MQSRTQTPLIILSLAAILVGVLLLVNSASAERTSVNAGSGVMTTTLCNTASSTLAFVPSPFTGATSTAILIGVKGTNAATSTDILIATSTTSAPSGLAVATSTLKENIMGLFSVSANSQFFSIAGQTMGPGTGYNSASGGTYVTRSTVVVGPSEGLLLFSTSTNPANNGGLAANALGVPASCTLEIVWIP